MVQGINLVRVHNRDLYWFRVRGTQRLGLPASRRIGTSCMMISAKLDHYWNGLTSKVSRECSDVFQREQNLKKRTKTIQIQNKSTQILHINQTNVKLNH